MPNRTSAVECISPAFARTKRLLFEPFRFGFWARLAVVALITGEAGGGGGGGGSLPNLNQNRGGDNHLSRIWTTPWAEYRHGVTHLFSAAGWEQMEPYMGWLVLGVVLLLGLLFLWVYSDCVYRFILLDAVVTGQCRLLEGWRRWRMAGRQYLLWVVGYGFAAFVLVGVVVGVPVLFAYRAGWFAKPDDHLWDLIGWGSLLVLVVIALVIVLAVIDLLARDFLVPLMAFEELGPMEGWQRLLTLMSGDKIAYGLYVLMKTALAMGGAIIFAIVNLIVILILMIPLALLGVFGYLIGRSAGVAWDNISVILLLAAFALLVLAGLLYVVGFVYSPALVFFQSYTLEFFAPRYGPLGSRIIPTSPTPPALAPPIPPATPLVPGDAFPG